MESNKGRKAPDFALKDKDGKSHSLGDMNAEYKVIYFYPKDNTPGCTIEAGEFNRYIKQFKEQDAIIIGISGGDEASKTKFCEKNKLELLLLSDSDFTISKKYGVYGEKSFMGRTFTGIKRMTYILDKDNHIIKIYEHVKPIGHAKEVLAFITAQKSS